MKQLIIIKRKMGTYKFEHEITYSYIVFIKLN